MKTTIRLLAVLLLVLTAALRLASAATVESNVDFKNGTGWIWHIKPQPPGWTMMANAGLVMRQDELKSEKLLLTLAHTVQSNRDVVHFRPVAFNAARQRFEFEADSGGSSDDAALQGFLLDLKTLPMDQIAFIGIEKLTVDNLRDFVAPASFRKLKEAGANALSFPRMGERYDFELSTIEGKKISSADFHGKVVLLDFWAGWCGPCMAKMPKLKETYRQWHSRGFEVVGLNHDQTLEAAKRVIRQQALPWSNILAPLDAQRELWWSATGTRSLPRLLLLDRDGVLRADVSPHDLTAEIEKLMAQH